MQERQIKLLEAIAAAAHPVSASDLASLVDMPRATLYRSIAALVECGFVEETDGGTRFIVGLRFIQIALAGLSDVSLKNATKPVAATLLAAYKQTVFLARYRDHKVEIVDIHTPQDETASYIYPGRGLRPAHACSSAKAIAAHLPEEAKNNLLSSDGKKLTEKTKIVRADLEADLALVRERGFAMCEDEVENGVSSIAVPIILDRNAGFFSLGVVGPTPKIVPLQDGNATDALIDAGTRATQLICAQTIAQ